MNIIHIEDEGPRVVCAECEFKFLEQHYFPHEFSESFWKLLSKKVGFWKALFDWIWEGIEKPPWAWVIIMTRWLQGRQEIWVHSPQGLWWVREDSCRLRVRQPSSMSVPVHDWAEISVNTCFCCSQVGWLVCLLWKIMRLWTFWTCVLVQMGNFLKEIHPGVEDGGYSIYASSGFLDNAKLSCKAFVLVHTPTAA